MSTIHRIKSKPKAKAVSTATATTGPMKTDESVSIKKISNGYLITRSCYDPKKGYSSTDTYSPVDPIKGVK